MDDVDDLERKRLKRLTRYEKRARANGFNCIAGVDEAGRGPLAGPVVAVACIIPYGVYIPFVNDSKLIAPKVRRSIFERLVGDECLHHAIGIVEPIEIDRINIYQATIQAMLMALDRLKVKPDYLLVDGMALPNPTPSEKIIKGYTLSQSIAAASIIAKEVRDDLMRGYHERWPHYGFADHKGYGTEKHLMALEEYGPCEIHRYSFDPIKSKIDHSRI